MKHFDAIIRDGPGGLVPGGADHKAILALSCLRHPLYHSECPVPREWKSRSCENAFASVDRNRPFEHFLETRP